MKQKIVIKLAMSCPKCRTKALEIASVSCGVISVAVEGVDVDRLVVIGDGVDSACLVKRLRKKLCYADLISVEEVKPPKPPSSPKPTPVKPPSPPRCPSSCHPHPCWIEVSVSEYESGPGCCIM